MKKVLIFLLLPLFCFDSFGQTNISGIINSYAAVTGLGCQSVSVSTTNGFASGDRVMLIQMKGAVIDSTNTPAFGTILNYNGAGTYEMATVQSISGNSIDLVDSVLRKYDLAGYVQVVKVPVYGNTVVAGALTCQAWNGSTGGVLAFEVNNTLTLNADIDASGMGFKGGTLSNGQLVSCLGDTSNYFKTANSASTAHKGEGIVNYKTSRADGKGSNANGGGAGHDCNGGGAGGGNYGLGGHGGDSKCNVSCPPYFYQNSGGHGGKSLFYSNSINKIYLGGGGGAGHQNNSGGSPGTNGGGIIFIKADSIAGNNHYIRSDGINNTLIANIDGQGGGGAGGTILFSNRAYNSLHVSVVGGYGGVDNFTGTDCHGKGGGGAGGVIWTTTPIVSGMTKYLSGGSPGIFTSSGSLCYNTGNGALAGQPGMAIIDLIVPESTAPCFATGIETFGSFQLVIYPNPASDHIEIKVPTQLIGTDFTVVDNLGRNVASGKFATELFKFNIHHLAPGAYLIKESKNNCFGKFIKN